MNANNRNRTSPREEREKINTGWVLNPCDACFYVMNCYMAATSCNKFMQYLRGYYVCQLCCCYLTSMIVVSLFWGVVWNRDIGHKFFSISIVISCIGGLVIPLIFLIYICSGWLELSLFLFNLFVYFGVSFTFYSQSTGIMDGCVIGMIGIIPYGTVIISGWRMHQYFWYALVIMNLLVAFVFEYSVIDRNELSEVIISNNFYVMVIGNYISILFPMCSTVYFISRYNDVYKSNIKNLKLVCKVIETLDFKDPDVRRFMREQKEDDESKNYTSLLQSIISRVYVFSQHVPALKFVARNQASSPLLPQRDESHGMRGNNRSRNIHAQRAANNSYQGQLQGRSHRNPSELSRNRRPDSFMNPMSSHVSPRDESSRSGTNPSYYREYEYADGEYFGNPDFLEADLHHVSRSAYASSRGDLSPTRSILEDVVTDDMISPTSMEDIAAGNTLGSDEAEGEETTEGEEKRSPEEEEESADETTRLNSQEKPVNSPKKKSQQKQQQKVKRKGRRYFTLMLISFGVEEGYTTINPMLMDIITNALTEYSGTLSEVEHGGESILCSFNAVQKCVQHEERACRCAILIIHKISRFFSKIQRSIDLIRKTSERKVSKSKKLRKFEFGLVEDPQRDGKFTVAAVTKDQDIEYEYIIPTEVYNKIDVNAFEGFGGVDYVLGTLGDENFDPPRIAITIVSDFGRCGLIGGQAYRKFTFLGENMRLLRNLSRLNMAKFGSILINEKTQTTVKFYLRNQIVDLIRNSRTKKQHRIYKLMNTSGLRRKRRKKGEWWMYDTKDEIVKSSKEEKSILRIWDVIETGNFQLAKDLLNNENIQDDEQKEIILQKIESKKIFGMEF